MKFFDNVLSNIANFFIPNFNDNGHLSIEDENQTKKMISFGQNRKEIPTRNQKTMNTQRVTFLRKLLGNNQLPAQPKSTHLNKNDDRDENVGNNLHLRNV